MTELLPVETDGDLVFTDVPQLGDEAGFTVVGDDGKLRRIVGNDLLVIGVVVDKGLPDQQVPTAMDSDPAILRSL